MSKLTIYHGSPEIIEKPQFGKGKTYNDYGRGFYCTELKNNENELLINTKYGNTVKIIFAENDDKEVVDTILDNLMISYKNRIRW